MPPTAKHEEAKAEQAKADKNDEAKAESKGNRQNEDAVPLGKSENLGKQPTTTVGDKEYEDLPADTQVALKSLASQATSVDSQGIERVVDRYVDGWEPAPVDPDPAEVKRLEHAREAYEAHRVARQNLLGAREEATREERPAAEERPVEAASA